MDYKKRYARNGKIMDMEYMAVTRDGVRNYEDFAKWRKANPVSGVLNWVP